MSAEFRIGEWLVDPAVGSVAGKDATAHLEPRVMEVLVYLARHPGEVIPKERLIQAVWADTFVTDWSLSHAVSELRKAFEDDATNPRFIQTLPKRGYRLIAKVESVEESAEHRYERKEVIGEGAMGQVYLAEDQWLRRKVALKFLREEGEDEKARKRLLREARATAALDHPFICKVYDTGEMEGRTFIAMEYVEGKTLKQKLAEGVLEPREALGIAGEMAEALERAHLERIVHRDVKPSNVMLTDQGHVKVMDFGIAKRLRAPEGQEQEWSVSLTDEVSTLGTLPYMSPEQVRGQKVDTRSDLFSFGVVLYEMLTGLHPFRRPVAADTAAAILEKEPVPLRRIRPELPQEAESLVTKLLAKDREDRWQSIEEVRSELARVPAESSHPTVAAPAPERIGFPWIRTRAALALLAALALAAVTWWWFSRP